MADTRLRILMALAMVQMSTAVISMSKRFQIREAACFTTTTNLNGQSLVQCAADCIAGTTVSNCFGFNYLSDGGVCMLSSFLADQSSQCSDTSVTYAPAHQPCPDEWHYYSGRDICLKAHETAVDFTTGQSICQGYGTQYGKTGRVIEFQSAEDYAWFKTNRRTLAGESLHDNKFQLGFDKVDGNWVWRSTGTNSSFYQWGGGQPSGSGGCVEMLLPSSSYSWNDLDCSNIRHTFCQLHL